MISVKVIEDSLTSSGARLTTLSLVYPRFIHSELMTHRALSRNAASSRAIPVTKVIEQIKTNPAMPLFWGKNQKGMQASDELEESVKAEAIKEWLAACDSAIEHAFKLNGLGLHKQHVNRILEPFMLMNTIVTATEWDNFFNLRADSPAQPEFKMLADAMLMALNTSMPMEVPNGWWHLPFVTEEERESTDPDVLLMYSVARCARVSYKNHEGKVDKASDIERYRKLLSAGHMSPFEHQAQALENPYIASGNFKGWKQYRKTLDNPFENNCRRLIKKNMHWLPAERLLMKLVEDQLRPVYANMSAEQIETELKNSGHPQHLIDQILFNLGKKFV